VTGPEQRAAQELRDEIRVRAGYGFRHDRAYVAKLIVAGPPSRAHGIRVTPAEDRYLDRRRKLGIGAKLGRYLRQRPEVMDFWDVRDDWPRGPYMAVFLADDPAKHRAAVKRLASYPRSTRIVRVRYSDRAKERVQRRIERDRDRLKRAGFELVETNAEWGRDRVDALVITKRKDAARYFARRYGSVVKAHAFARRTTPACLRAYDYEIAPDGMSLTVSWQDGPTKPLRVEVTERGDHVAVGLVEAQSLYPSFGPGRPNETTVVRLREPLGARPVYDAYDGRRLVQSGPSPGAPPCPVRPEPGVQSPLDSLIAQREGYGMNADPAYVQSLVDAGLEYTPEEQAWIDLDERYTGNDVEDYLQGGRERRDWGGNAYVARYPEPPYLIVRLIGHFALRERDIRAIAQRKGLDVRFERSTVQRDWFYTLPQYIDDDARRADGYLEDFYVVGAEGDEGDQAVDVWVITTRTQAEADAYFKPRYGGIVRVHIIGDRVECRGGYSTR